MNKIIATMAIIVLSCFGLSCTKINEHPKPQKISIEQCYLAKVIIIDKDEDFEEQIEYARENTHYACHCIIQLGDTTDGTLITFYAVHRGGMMMWDYDGNSHDAIKYVDNIYKQITGEEMPESMCK